MQEIHQSYWAATATAPTFSNQYDQSHYDVAIIGAGLTGITTAALLVETGATVCVLEADCVGSGTTGKTTAKVTLQHRLKYHEIMKKMGVEAAFQYAKANQLGLEQIAHFVEDYQIDCDFKRTSSCVYAETKEDIKQIDNELVALQQLNLPFEIINQIPSPFLIDSGICIHHQAQFHPLKYLFALAKKINQSPNGAIYEHAFVKAIDKGNPCTIHFNHTTLTADTVVLATNYPIKDMPGFYFTRLHQARSYIVSVCPNRLLESQMLINAHGTVNSIRTHDDNQKQQLLVGGYGHKTGKKTDNQSSYDQLFNFLSKKLNVQSQPKSTIYQWSTQDCVSIDGIPYVGALSPKTPNIYIATGYGKWGMTNATAASLILANTIQSTKHPIMDTAELFSPRRFTPNASAKSFIIQGLESAEAFTLGNIDIPKGSLDDVASGEGKILRIDGRAMALYRDNDGKLSAFNPHCTHLGCPLTYNAAEQSWDCCCHGSRFDMNGNVLEGPATKPLKAISLTTK